MLDSPSLRRLSRISTCHAVVTLPRDYVQILCGQKYLPLRVVPGGAVFRAMPKKLISLRGIESIRYARFVFATKTHLRQLETVPIQTGTSP